MQSTLGRLQERVTKLEKENTKLRDRNDELRSENNLLKLKYKQLEQNFEKKIDEKVTKAVNETVEKLTKHFEKIINEKDKRIFELETRLNINSSNSSLPSSKNPIHQSKICNSRKKTGAKPGGKLGHAKHKLKKFDDEDVTEIKEHKLDECTNCNSKNLKVTEIKERDELDFEIKIIKRRHKFYCYKCLDCGKEIKATIPVELSAENQYGSNVKALGITLINHGFVSYNRTRKIIFGLTNSNIDPCEGYLTKLQKKTSSLLKDFVFDVKQEILKSKLNYWDDTVVAIADKDKACMRTYTNSKHVLYKAHMSKDTTGMDEDGILQNLPSNCIVMHDHLKHNYCDDYQYDNLECNAHITRKLEGITQNTKHNWSDRMKKLLENTLKRRKEYIDKEVYSFSETEISEFDKEYDSIVEDGFKEYIEFKHKYEFEKEENLLEFLRDFKGPITAWVRDFSLPYSNNICETLLRMLKSKMKISYRFKSLEFARCFADIMTYSETCGKFGINKYEAFKRLFNGNPYTVAELNAIIATENEQ